MELIRKTTIAALAFSMTAGMASAQTDAETQEDCLRIWSMAERAGIVGAVSNVRGVTTVEVEEEGFMESSFAEKKDIIDKLNCAALGPDKVFSEVAIVSDRTNKRLAR